MKRRFGASPNDPPELVSFVILHHLARDTFGLIPVVELLDGENEAVIRAVVDAENLESEQNCRRDRR